MKTFEDENLYIYVGQDCKENWQLLDKADPEDRWIHLDNKPSPYVIIHRKHPDYTVNKYDMQYAGELCIRFSKFKKSKREKICYLPCEFVQKGRSTGSVNLLKEPSIKTIRNTGTIR
jgi:predicted ribosome quality control (RQC) complex YloA/Tae2 family protein